MGVYGYDWGEPDLDVPRNRDCDAISYIEPHDVESRMDSPATNTPPAREEWYYSKPVPLVFPGDLKPLPKCLLDNNMNMLYYHYFVDYTSKILVTHDCASNPFRTILPRLALEDDNLMSLILAYASCHRARLLNHREPINRIAAWVSQLWPRFREALASGRPISETLFGTCVMLASFTQSFPYAFEAPISWPQHLSMARQMCISVTSGSTRPRSKAAYFFLRWFAYLDTFGSCSANVYNGSHESWSRDLLAAESDPSLRCLTGFTNSSLSLLSRAVDLAKRCDHERRTTGQLSSSLILLSQQLRCNLELASLEAPYKTYDCQCLSMSASSSTYRAVNAALCHTALIILHRRVYTLPSNSPLVQASVGGILASLSRHDNQNPIDIPDIILPLFLAGCESRDLGPRQEVLRRLQRIGDAGMSQVSRVRALLLKVWDTNQDWVSMEHDILLG